MKFLIFVACLTVALSLPVEKEETMVMMMSEGDAVMDSSRENDKMVMIMKDVEEGEKVMMMKESEMSKISEDKSVPEATDIMDKPKLEMPKVDEEKMVMMMEMPKEDKMTMMMEMPKLEPEMPKEDKTVMMMESMDDKSKLEMETDEKMMEAEEMMMMNDDEDPTFKMDDSKVVKKSVNAKEYRLKCNRPNKRPRWCP
jgi:hypothetical protein